MTEGHSDSNSQKSSNNAEDLLKDMRGHKKQKNSHKREKAGVFRDNSIRKRVREGRSGEGEEGLRRFRIADGGCTEETLRITDRIDWGSFYSPGVFNSSKEIPEEYDGEVNGENYGSEINEIIRDRKGNTYTKGEMLRIIQGFKKDSRNFFVGDYQDNCAKMNRRYDDRWYIWSREMMENSDKNGEMMNDILAENSHTEIKRICKSIGGEEWTLNIDEKIKRIVAGIKSVERGICSERGLKTCWGRIRFGGFFKSRFTSVKDQFGSRNGFDLSDYFSFRNKRWQDRFKRQKEKEESRKLYEKY